MRLSRRAVLAGGASSFATSLVAEAPFTSLRPVARVVPNDAVARFIDRAGLSGQVGFVAADMATGEIVESIAPDLAQPPASVTKAFTALYGIETLGSDFQFETQVIAVGAVNDGVLEGDLILAGGGNPNLVTDDLAALAMRLRDAGLREVKGDFLVWDNALSNVDEIDTGQEDYLGYNPTVTGLNLNFNRVHFEWKRAGETFATTMDARSENYRPDVSVSRIRVVDRASPVFTYRDVGDVDHWTVAKSALNNAGSRWLPVRHPALYCGEVFATFARSHGIVLQPAKEIAVLPAGDVLATHRGIGLTALMQSMLRFSTNLTAEAVGLLATAHAAEQQRGLRTSALSMARWAAGRAPGTAPQFVDHSGLGDASRVSAGDMVRFLLAEGVPSTLRPIMKNIPLVGDDRNTIDTAGVAVSAKTGTLNFVSSLAGYMRTARGRDLAFAYFAADLEARAAGKLLTSENPPGARSWNTQARRLQQQILQHWALRVG